MSDAQLRDLIAMVIERGISLWSPDGQVVRYRTQRPERDRPLLEELRPYRDQLAGHGLARSPEEAQPAIEGYLALVRFCGECGINARWLLRRLDVQDLLDFQSGRIGVKAIKAFALALSRRQAIERGQVPPGFDHAGSCRHCGPVWLTFPGHDLNGCPWCRNRLTNRHIPRPKGDHEHEQAETAVR